MFELELQGDLVVYTQMSFECILILEVDNTMDYYISGLVDLV